MKNEIRLIRTKEKGELGVLPGPEWSWSGRPSLFHVSLSCRGCGQACAAAAAFRWVPFQELLPLRIPPLAVPMC